ncbi:MAG: histidine kinase [Armatimonadota bacterium]|nr:histidine kinase [Armatimonadota bacterium]
MVVGGFSIYALVVFQRRAALRQFEVMAQTVAGTVLHSLMTTMINNNPDETKQIIRHIEEVPVVHRVTVFSPGGRIWASSHTGEVGAPRPSALLAQVIATGRPATAEYPAAGELLVLVPIPNRRECHACHPAGRPILGAIGVTLGTGQVAEHLRSTARMLAGLVGFTFLLALGTLSVLLGRFVLEPLSTIVAAVREVTRGNFTARASVQSADELGLLAAAFNDMSARIEQSTSSLHAQVADLTRRLSTLTVFSRALTAAEDLQSALAEAAEAMRDAVGADACRIYGWEGEAAVPVAGAGATDLVDPWGTALARAATGSGPPAALPGIRGLGATVTIPLRTRDRELGAMVVVRRDPRPFQASDVLLLQTVATQLAVAMDNVSLFAQVRAQDQLRRELVARLLRAHEEERSRIARELHDEVSQSLTSLMMRIHAAEEALPEHQETRGALAGIRSVVEQTLEDVRKIIFALRPTLLDDLGLIPAVRYYARNLLEPAGVQVHIHATGFGARRLPREVETTVFRIAQEAITNIARHSRARHAAVSLEFTGTAVRLEIHDDGVGFDVAASLADPSRRRLGLLGMQERVALVGGTLSIDSRPGGGTVVRADIPVPPPPAEEDARAAARAHRG